MESDNTIIKKRKPWLAGILSVLVQGLGHFYCGRAKRGIVIYFVYSFLIVLTALLALINIYIAALILLSITIAVIVDAVKIAKNETNYKLKKYNKFYIYFAIYLLSAFFSPVEGVLIKHYLLQAFKIPSGAMEPSILVGDHILANKFVYNFEEPKRGDIIIFEYPEDLSKDFIKRVVGLGGDKIEITNKQVYINDEALEEQYAVFKAGDTSSFGIQKSRNFGPFTVPDGHFFVMGDNRDNSHDSRYWGTVAKEAIKGRATTVYWSWDRKSGSGRWDRIGIKF